MGPLLITGASGFLGWHLATDAAKYWKVVGLFQRHPIEIPGVTAYESNVTNPNAMNVLLNVVKPCAIIHTAAMANPNECELNPNDSYHINVHAAHYLAHYAAERRIPYIFISTDLVFDGTKPPYAEMDKPNPMNVYAHHKAKAEMYVLNAYPEATVCRLPLLFGSPTPHSNSFMQNLIADLQSGKSVQLFTDEWRTPVMVDSAVKGILLALEKRITGILHLGGRQRLSRYEIGLAVKSVLNLTDARIQVARQSEIPMPAARPKDVSLNSSRAFMLGYQPGTVEEGIARLHYSTSVIR